MCKQTALPTLWLIVDDGSADETPQIVEDAAQKHPWIRLHRRVDRGERAVGGGVVQAFNEGLTQVNLDDYQYVCKLDADLGLPENYFESLIREMEADSLLGNFSGKTYIQTASGAWVSERMGDENAIGASKFYRVECFREIGGFVPEACWDGIDGHMCRMMGWKAMSLDRPELRLRHYRPQGSSQQSVWVGRKRWGRGKYFMGSSLTYVAVVSLYRMLERPFIIGGLGIMTGYLQARWSRHERFGNEAYLQHLRRCEMMSLLLGKHRTMRRYHQRIEDARQP
jgi:cellulose synthase/poly-beta-1,6-N-acetylglucosamine synthase-like glycosyltransferase